MGGKNVARLTPVGWVVFPALVLRLLGGAVVQFQEGLLKLEDDRTQQDQWIHQEAESESASEKVNSGLSISQDNLKLSQAAGQDLRKTLESVDTSIRGEQQLAISLWREQHPFGQISGMVTQSIDLKRVGPSAPFSLWLKKVTSIYTTLKASGQLASSDGQYAYEVSTTAPHQDLIRFTFGPAPDSKAGATSPNASLIPTGPNEDLVDSALFHARYAVFASRDDSTTHLMGTSMFFTATSGFLNVLFDSSTMQPTAISIEHGLTGEDHHSIRDTDARP